MASPETLTQGATGNSGALTADTLFHVLTGKVWLSTDSGTTYVPFDNGDKVIFSSGITVTWQNRSTEKAILNYMAI